jgi:uncharacterized protein YjbJ (UPF0337 family)
MNDKANYTVIHHLGAAKEGAGKFTGNDELKREGQNDQPKARLPEAVEKVEVRGS